MKIKKSLLIIMIVTSIFIFSGLIQANYDFEGETVTIGSFWNLEDLYTGDGDHVEWASHIEDTFNCNIEFTQISDTEFVDTVISGVMSGDPEADIYIIQSMWVDSLANAGALYPVGDILDDEYYESLPGNHRELIKEYAYFDGKIWGFSSNDNVQPNYDLSGVYGLLWNKELFENEGLPSIYELEEEGEWTWSKFREIADKATRDTTGDNEIDQWGTNATGFFPVMFGYINNAKIYKEVDGRMKFSFNEEPALEALRFWSELVNEDNSVFTEGGLAPIEQFVQGNLAMLIWDRFAIDYANGEGMENYGWSLIPKAPNEEEHKAPLFMTMFQVLPATVDNPEALVKVGSALFRTTDEYREMDEYFDDVTEGFGDVATDYKSVENYRKMFHNPVMFPHPASPIKGMGQTNFWEQVASVVFEGESASAAMDAVEPEVQSTLDDIFN